MKKKTRSFLLTAVIALAIALTLIACGLDDLDDDEIKMEPSGNSYHFFNYSQKYEVKVTKGNQTKTMPAYSGSGQQPSVSFLKGANETSAVFKYSPADKVKWKKEGISIHFYTK